MPSISHLLFVDDSFLFCRAGVEEAWKLKAILKAYESAFRQAINVQKYLIFFSPSTSENVREDMMNILDIETMLGQDKYLGLSSLVGKNKK